MDPLIARHIDDIHRIAALHGVTRIRVVGSRARGDARPDSDLDLLVDIDPARNALDLVGFKLDLEELLGVTVELGQEQAIRPAVRHRMLQDVVDL